MAAPLRLLIGLELPQHPLPANVRTFRRLLVLREVPAVRVAACGRVKDEVHGHTEVGKCKVSAINLPRAGTIWILYGI